LSDFYTVNRLSFSLKTKSVSTAVRFSNSISQRLEDYWLGLRLQKMDIPATSLVRKGDVESGPGGMSISDALELYLRLKGKTKDAVFTRTATRNVGYVVKVLGDRSIPSYSSADAAGFRDWLISKKMSIKTVKRIFSSVRAIVNLAIAENGIECINGFSKTYFPEDGQDQTRKPIPISDIQQVQGLCRAKDDDMRWLIGLISDTGMRLGEAVGLQRTDIKLDDGVPHIQLKPHPWRSLKTVGSKRNIPLAGHALWAAGRILAHEGVSDFAFLRYCNGISSNANSASGGLNKWLQEYVPDGCVIHSFRHSLRDRLRSVECPSDIVDAIGGWKTAGVGLGYGKGYPRFVKCLHTKSEIKAARLSHELSSRLENIWDRMRLEVLDFRSDKARSLIVGKDRVSTRVDFRLSDAFELHLQLKAIGKPDAFKIYTARNERYLIERIGDIHLEDLVPSHGAEFRDHLVGKGLSAASIKRVFSTIKAVVSLCISERGLSVTNPFSDVYVPEVGAVTKRMPIPIDAIRVIQTECLAVDDGIKLDADIPHLDLKPHPWT
jgi:integrase